jgi:hypothetical protein
MPNPAMRQPAYRGLSMKPSSRGLVYGPDGFVNLSRKQFGNNRVEESLGNATDLWTAFHEQT